ncbi:hypothetical protein OG21DRAFT_376643 [Imleria badia]|nr:hypothetical protein OG21DRAFT_376643 [Imleria badia]
MGKTFPTPHARSLADHRNLHSGEQPPFVCSDLVEVPSTSGNSSQPFVYEVPCGRIFDTGWELLEHRKTCHRHRPSPDRSRKGARAPRSRHSPVHSKAIPRNDEASYSRRGCASATFPQHPDNEHHSPQDSPHDLATTSRQDSFYDVTRNDAAHTRPEPSCNAGLRASGPEAKWIPSPSAAPYAANYYNSVSAHSYMAFQPSHAPIPFHSTFPLHLGTLHGQVSNAFTFAQDPTKVNTMFASKYTYGDRSVSSLPLPILPYNPSTVWNQNSQSCYITNNDSAYTSPEPTYNTTIQPEVESIQSGSVATYTTKHGSSPAAVETFCKNNHSELSSLHGDDPNENGSVGTLGGQPNDASSPVVQENNHTDPSFASGLPLLSVPRVFPETPIDDNTEILSDLEIELHEDDIFFRGTGREGCLCPEMMIGAGIEGWEKSVLDTRKEYYTHSFA